MEELLKLMHPQLHKLAMLQLLHHSLAVQYQLHQSLIFFVKEDAL